MESKNVLKDEQCEKFTTPTSLLCGMRDTYALLRTAIPFIEQDRVEVEANISYAQYEVALIDQEIKRIQPSLKTQLQVTYVRFKSPFLNQEILQAQHRLEKLLELRGALHRFEKLERGLLSPIRRLPVEILRHIFIQAHTGKLNPHNMSEFPRVAAQVWSFWRSVVHSCAPIWANIRCGDSRTKDKINPMYGKLLEDCLRFSNEMTLSLDFINLYPASKHLGKSCIQALGRSVYRWKNVIIRHNELTKAIFAAIPKESSFENLESLDLKFLRGAIHVLAAPKLMRLNVTGDEFGDRNVRITIDSAPLLHYLFLSKINHPYRALSGLDWNQITEFVAAWLDFQPDELTVILGHMRNLISLSVYGGQNHGNTRRITFSRLKALRIEGLEPGDIYNMFTAPNIHKLYVGRGTDVLSAVEFVRRSGCTLEYFGLATLCIDNRWLTREFTNVKTLFWDCFDDPVPTLESIKRLTFEKSPSPDDVFPMLERLEILNLDGPTETENNEWSITAFVDMLKSRLPIHHTKSTTRSYLKYMEIIFRHALEDEDAGILTDFAQSNFIRSSGVEIDIWDVGSFRVRTSQ